MLKAGDVFENPVTGERGVVRVGTEESGGELLVVELYVRPGGAVAGEHVHPVIHESFTIVSGQIGFRLDGRESVAGPGKRLRVPPGMVHDWWNAGDEEAHVIVEVRPAERFEEAIRNTFGLAQDGKTNARGIPTLLQAALFAREFDDVLYFTKPPRSVQKILFAVLAPIARLLGYRGSYPEYLGGSRPRGSRSSRGRNGRAVLASQSILISSRAATQHTTVAAAVIQASLLSPERTASNQKKALARAQEMAPRNQKDALTSVPV